MAKEFKENNKKGIWSILNIEQTTDIKEIRHAYAEESKNCHPETEPDKFQQLYQAYQDALKWAKANKKQEKTRVAVDEGEVTQKQKQVSQVNEIISIENETVGTEHKIVDIESKNIGTENEIVDIESETVETENEIDHYKSYEMFFSKLTPVAQKGLESFIKYFESADKKDWKEYVTTPDFLRAQYDETFAKQLAEYLKKQSTYSCEELPYQMVKELYFSYYPFMSEDANGVFSDAFFENGFRELFEVIFLNKEIERILELHEDASAKSEVIKYHVYYRLHCAMKKNGANQNVSEWEVHIVDAARECFIENGKESHRDKYLFSLIAFIVNEAPVLSDDIYKLLIDKFNLYQTNGFSKEKECKVLYDAISSKCDNMQKLQAVKMDEKAERRQLTEEIEKWYYERLTDEDRPRLQEYFNTGLFYKYRLDEWLLEYRLMVFALQYKSFPKVFLEEYLAFYDKVYEETGSSVGKELYHMFVGFLAECDVKKTYNEVAENKKEWVLQYFFEEGFTRVWRTKAAMRGVYKSIVLGHLNAIAQGRNYEWDLWDDGHIKAEKIEENYVLSYDKINEQVTMSQVEYFQIVEEMTEIYKGRYFMISSEKNGINEVLERAREAVYGNNRN